MLKVERWDDTTRALSEEAVAALFPSSREHSVSCRKYPAGASFSTLMRAARCYVVAGECVVRSGDESTTLRAGDVAQLPEGTYRVQVGDAELRWVLVFALPAL